MGLFSSRRDPEDPYQLVIAVHELGHGYAWRDSGLIVHKITVTAEDGATGVRVRRSGVGGIDETELYDYAVGCWAGFEAEDKWLRQRDLGRAKRGHSSHDIRNFQAAVRELGGGLSEDKARELARERITRRWSQIQKLAPGLVRHGHINI